MVTGSMPGVDDGWWCDRVERISSCNGIIEPAMMVMMMLGEEVVRR